MSISEKDIFDDMNSFFRDLGTMYSKSGTISLELPPLSPEKDSPYLYPPTNPIVQWIWYSCELGQQIRQHRISLILFEWARKNNFYFLNSEHQSHISFSYNNCKYTFQWPAFEKWFLFHCSKSCPASLETC